MFLVGGPILCRGARNIHEVPQLTEGLSVPQKNYNKTTNQEENRHGLQLAGVQRTMTRDYLSEVGGSFFFFQVRYKTCGVYVQQQYIAHDMA